MSTLRDGLISQLVNPASRRDNMLHTLGRLISVNNDDNTCSIRYTNKSGVTGNRENVVLKLNNSDTPPQAGDLVYVEDTGDICMVTGKYVGNYAMDEKSKKQLRQDVLSDETGCMHAGGEIF